MVIGLGLIGLLTVQLLRANGCRVLGIDLDPGELALARQFGAEMRGPVRAARTRCRPRRPSRAGAGWTG